jgi:hypothetical protein
VVTVVVAMAQIRSEILDEPFNFVKTPQFRVSLPM